MDEPSSEDSQLWHRQCVGVDEQLTEENASTRASSTRPLSPIAALQLDKVFLSKGRLNQ